MRQMISSANASNFLFSLQQQESSAGRAGDEQAHLHSSEQKQTEKTRADSETIR